MKGQFKNKRQEAGPTRQQNGKLVRKITVLISSLFLLNLQSSFSNLVKYIATSF